MPVVARAGKFVFAQSIGDVAAFLGLDVDATPQLSPDDLIGRLDAVLTAAVRHCRQMPDAELATELPNRPRSYRVLMHHIFRIPEAFLDAMQGETLSHEMLVAPPPPDMATTEDIAAYGEAVRRRALAWWQAHEDKTCTAPVSTYYGTPPLHEVLERTVWHAAQHVRQLTSLLEGLDIQPDRPLTAKDLAGLPLPEKVWDD